LPKVCFIIIDMYVKYYIDHQNSFLENLFFGSPEKLLKCSCYTIIIKQRYDETLFSSANDVIFGCEFMRMKTENYLSLIFRKIYDFLHKFILDHKSDDFTILVVNFTILYCLFYGFTVDFTVSLLILPFYC
jgi:hypothetical protein